jgi:hypothetical protein
MLTMERRRAPRTRLRELVYIGMGTDNGGVVLDVSDGGLAFHAVASVQQDSPIHFSLSVEGRRRVEGFAEVAWNSAAGKCAGLRFTHLPEEVREQIQIWSKQPRLNLPVAGESFQPMETRLAPNSVGDAAPVEITSPVADNASLSDETVEQVPNPSVVSPQRVAEIEGASPELEAAEHPAPRPRTNPLSMFPPEPAGQSIATAHPSPYAVPSKHGVFAIVLTVILAFVIAIGGLSYAYLHGAGKYLLQLGEKIWGWF